MTKTSASTEVDNVLDDCTLSGISLSNNELLSLHMGIVAEYLLGYSQAFLDYFWRAHGDQQAARVMQGCLDQARSQSALSDFIADEGLDMVAAFGMVQIDRIVRLALASPNGPPGWRTLDMYDQIAECSQRVLIWNMERDKTNPDHLEEKVRRIQTEQNRRAAQIGQEKRYGAGKAMILEYLEKWRRKEDLYETLEEFVGDMVEKQAGPQGLKNRASIKRFVKEAGGCPKSKVKNY